ESLVEANYAVVHEALTSVPGVEVTRRTYRGDAERAAATLHDDKVQGGVPGLELLELVHKLHGPDAGHLDLSTIHPLSGAEVVESIRFRRALNEKYRIPYAGGIILLPRSVLNISTFFFDTNDQEATRAAYSAYGEMVVELGKAGYPVYRT